ncbi:MAG: molecular chaperone HtpG [Oscillospiraceae bacterium]|nr:molecular chaperone HtpG [Oscillospiraceae bacterium]
MAKKQFKAESKRLLDLMINSIYTHKEIFLREIISNASDAIDKLCYRSLTDESVGLSREDFLIRIDADKEARTLTVSDNGIGMTKDELEHNLGVIASSGTRQFRDTLAESEEAADMDVIGQFGVGFYSAFMVADKVTVITKAFGEEQAYRWESSGADGYTITECDKDAVGTDVIMHIKEDTDQEEYGTYLESWELKELVKKYSDYVRWPIHMMVERREWDDKGGEDGKGEYKTIVEDQVVNTMVPIWQRPKSEVSDDDCKAYYKEHFHDAADPVAVIRVNAEGLTSYKAMLFIPAQAPYDYYTRDYQPGLQLYSSGVMIMDKCADLVPEHFRCVRGGVDSPDLSLNISREPLQHDRQLKIIAGNLEKKILAELKRLMDEDREHYLTFYKAFAPQLKYGVVGDYGMHKEQLQDLLMFYSANQDKLVSLKEYVDALPAGQTKIYYACAETAKRAAALPQAETVKAAGYDMLCLTDNVDEFVMQMLGTYSEKSFCNVTSDDLGLESEEEKKETEEKSEQYKELLDFVKESLGGTVETVRLSHKLKSQPVFLTTEGEVTLEMEKYFQNLPGVPEGENVKAHRVLELNANHAAFAALEKAWQEDKTKAAHLSMVLLAQAQLIAGIPLDDPAAYTELVCELF